MGELLPELLGIVDGQGASVVLTYVGRGFPLQPLQGGEDWQLPTQEGSLVAVPMQEEFVGEIMGVDTLHQGSRILRITIANNDDL